MSEKNQNGQPWYLISIVLVAVLGGLLFGYDTAVISGAEKGLQAFFRSARDFTYTDALHGFTTSSALIGCVIGALLSGLLSTRLGRRRSLLIAGMLFFLSALGSYAPEFLLFPPRAASKGVLIAFIFYRILGGIGVGLASAICPMYIAEVAPASQRGKLVSWNQFAIIFGQLVVYFVNFLIIQSHKNDPMIVEWTNTVGWRNMFVSEAFPAGLFTLLILLVPESPRHLVIMGLDNQALKILTRINGEKRAKVILQDIKETVVERREKLFAYGYMVIFIGCMLSVFQQIIGINAVLYFAPRIFESMGVSDNMLFTVIMGIINISFTLVAVFTVEKLGRKPLLISGSIGMAIGALGVALSNVVTMPAIVPVISIMVYSACFMFSWGPICWVYIAELFPNTIRSQATALAVAFQWIFNFIVSSTFVPMYNMKLGAMGESFGHFFAYALYGMICIAAAIFVWRLVPETKGKTLEEMTTLWRERNKKSEESKYRKQE
ncbi:MAG: D-xylose transporter XylE [Bacteroidales bacterium]|nr:D-xylose transporter XylE [Bacteroidales bacterium]